MHKPQGKANDSLTTYLLRQSAQVPALFAGPLSNLIYSNS